MSSLFVENALLESGMPEAGTSINDEVFGKLTFMPNAWTKSVHLNYFGLQHSISIYVHTKEGKINDIQRECYKEFMSDIEGTLNDYKNIFKTGSKIDCLVFQLDSLVVVLTGKTDDEYMVLEFEI